MARYTVLERTFINGTVANPGEVVEYDGQPGSSLQPMDTSPSVDIPDNWRDKNGLERIALARSLGAPKARLSAAEADAWINNAIVNRDAKAKEKPPAKPALFGSAPAEDRSTDSSSSN
jgi:hypothetical protein